MRKFLISGCALALLTATACNSASNTPAQNGAEPGTATSVPAAGATSAATPAATTTAAAPQPTQGYDWDMRTDDDANRRWAILAYEMPNTDDQPLHFTCEGGNSIIAGIDSGQTDLTRITLASGDQTVTLNGTTEVHEEADMASFRARPMTGDSPFLAAFAQNGWLRLTVNGTTQDMAATPAARAAISRFLTYCNAGAG